MGKKKESHCHDSDSISDYFDLLCPDDYASFVDADNGLKR